jgi:hypothetical protein
MHMAIEVQKGSTDNQLQLSLYQFYCLLRVLAFVKSHHQKIKKIYKKINLSTTL